MRRRWRGSTSSRATTRPSDTACRSDCETGRLVLLRFFSRSSASFSASLAVGCHAAIAVLSVGQEPIRARLVAGEAFR